MKDFIESRPVLIGASALIVGAFLGAIGTIVGSSIAGGGEEDAVKLSIQATQTAEAISTQINIAVVQTAEAIRAQTPPTSVPLENACAQYGLEITEPPGGYSAVNGQVTLEGTYAKRPSQESIQLFSTANSLYWPEPRENIHFTAAQQGWSSVVFTNGNISLIIAVVGDSGRVLTDYFRVVVKETGKFPGIPELTSDIIPCEKVFVGQ